jgi:nucleoside-diphosphate-sugar epimerase
MRYLVTGATGLVGSHLIDALMTCGHEVRALVRQLTIADGLRRRGVEACLGDLTDEAVLPAAVEDRDVVVHCAGVVQTAGEHRDLWPVNVTATERLLAASATAGVRRFVHLSSVAVYGPAPQPIVEDTPKRPTGPYGKSKWAAEEAVWRHHAGGLPAVALRPCAIYGGRDRHAWPMLARLGRLPVLPLPAGGRRLLDLVHVSDVIDAVLAAATTLAAAGRAYNLTDGESHSYRDILLAYGEAAGRRPAILPIPSGALRLVSRVGGRLGRLGVLDLDVHYSIDAAVRDLGYRPRIGLREGVRRTLRDLPAPASEA